MATKKRGPAPITITLDVDNFDNFIDKLEHAVDLQYGHYHFSALHHTHDVDQTVADFLCITPEG
jgi:hypothetical protein